MSARSDDLARIQEIYDVVVRTQSQLDVLGFTRERFLDPQNDADDLLAEGFMNRVLRVTEEVGRISDNVARQYGFDMRGASGVRNRLAHAYMEVDREIVWQMLNEEFGVLLGACQNYCDDRGLELA